MKVWTILREAYAGWVKIVRGDISWPGHFRLTPSGLVTALAIFAITAFLSIAFAAAGIGVPALPGFIAAMLVQALACLALVLGVIITRQAVPSQAPLISILVPGIYALVAYLVLGTLLSLIGGPLLIVLWLALAYLLYRLARVAAGWTFGVSLAFATLTLALLVGMPLTLYTLTGPTT